MTPKEKRTRVLAALAEGPMTLADIARHANANAPIIGKTVTRMREANELHVCSRAWRTPTYALGPAPADTVVPLDVRVAQRRAKPPRAPVRDPFLSAWRGERA